MVGKRFDNLLFYQISSRLYHLFRISCAVEGRILSGIQSKGPFPAPHILDYESWLPGLQAGLQLVVLHHRRGLIINKHSFLSEGIVSCRYPRCVINEEDSIVRS